MSPTRRDPRIWPVALAFVGIFLASQIAGGIAMVVVLLGSGGVHANRAELERAAQSLWPLVTLIVVSELTLVGLTLLFARLSRGGVRPLLGLGRPRAAWPAWVLAPIGTFSVFLIVCIAAALGLEVSGSKSQFDGIERAEGAGAWLLILCGSLLPAIGEELLFRGLLQRCLVARLGPVAGIAITSALFGLAHFDNLPHVLATTLYGVWFGVLAWRTGSVWLSALCHAINNGVLFAGAILLQGSGEPGAPNWAVLIGVGVFTAACAVAALGFLRGEESDGTDDHPASLETNPADASNAANGAAADEL